MIQPVCRDSGHAFVKFFNPKSIACSVKAQMLLAAIAPSYPRLCLINTSEHAKIKGPFLRPS